MPMSSSRHNYLEEARPPEDPVKSKCFEKVRGNYRYYYKRPSVADPRKLSIGAVSLPSGLLLAPEPDIRDSNAGAVVGADGTVASGVNNNCDKPTQLAPCADERNSNNLHESDNFKETNQLNGSLNANDVENTIDSNYNTESMASNNRTSAGATIKQCKRISMTTPQNRTMKSESYRENRSVGGGGSSNRRPASLPSTEQNTTGTNRKRGSYHQDVEEALSSLLWQPYEYRTQSDSSDTLSTLSTTGSSSSTSLSLDLTANKNKGAGGGLLQSFTDEFLNVTTPTTLLPGGSGGAGAAWPHSGNTADPNLTTQMVSNLMVLDAATVGPALAQYAWTTQSRGYDGGLALSQVDLERSRVRELVSRCSRLSSNGNIVTTAATAVSTTAAHQQQQYFPSSSSSSNSGSRCGNHYIGNASGASVREYRSAVCDDLQQVSGGDMRVEIPGSGPPPERQATSVLSVPDVTYTPPKPTVAISASSATTSGHRQQNVLFQCNSVSVGSGVTNECVSIQTVASPPAVRMTAGDGGSGNRSIHVQPLTVNTRCTTGTGVCTISSDMIPSNITSVVSANVVGLPVHSRSSSNLSAAAASRADIVPPNHPRSMSETANVFVQSGQQHNVGNHLRSSSNSHVVGLIPIPNHPRNHSLTGVVQTRGTSEPVSVTANSSMTTSVFNSNSQRAPSVPQQSVAAVTANAATAVLHNHVRANSENAPRNSNFEATQKQTDNTTNVYHGRSTTAQDAPQSRVPPLPNVSNVNVNFYRAVPVNVVSSVPTIQCLNSVEDAGNNVSNVHIVQAMPSSVPCTAVTTQQVLVQQHQPPPPSQPPQQHNVPEVRTRTFTSTEAQTDDTAVGAIVAPTVLPPSANREQRRRDRRERRHQRRLNSSNHQHQLQMQQQQQLAGHPQMQQQHWPGSVQQQQQNERLPDLLNSHLPPPYSTLPSSMQPVVPAPMVPAPIVTNAIMPSNTMVASPIVPNTMVSFHPAVVPGQVPLVQGAPPVPVPAPHTGFRFPFPTAAGFRRCRSRLGPRYSTEEHQPKSCCGFLVNRPGSLRWFIALIALVAVCCVLVGTVLGAMRPAGRDHLTVSLLMIGVGIVLVTVSGVAWRLTSHDAPSCRAMLGLESSDSTEICTRRFVPRLPPSYGRPHHPYAAMIYPEFQYRPPPPSYQASMQEYRLRLLLLDRGATPQITNAQHAVSPPPTYRSHAGSLLRAPLSNRRDATQSEYSCPPSYRSRTSTNRQPSMDNTVHSREQSLSLSESNHDGSVVNVVNILANQEEEIALENMTLDSLKVAPENEIPPLRMLLKSSSGSDLETSKDGNLVTIVQKADQNPVIVTVSGSQMSTTNPEVGSSNQSTEMEILAHL